MAANRNAVEMDAGYQRPAPILTVASKLPQGE